MYGYTGRILSVNLSERSHSAMDTREYEQWGGGHGMGSAIFFDLVKDKTIDGFHRDNVVTLISEHIAKLVAWHRHYSRFWKQSLLFCDQRWPDIVNARRPDKIGSTGDSEPAFFEAVTGKGLSFREGVEMGRKIWNLDQVIRTLQGRHRDLVHFAGYIYNSPYRGFDGFLPYLLPGRIGRIWVYMNVAGRSLDRDKFEEFKTRFYEIEGWDPASGYPPRTTLHGLGLDYVADELEANGTLGAE